jgi:prepilin-type N-terminal cleavage/methylation domain-containing protein
MSDRGFTLLEILLVAAVLGIMALAVIPSVQPYKEQRLDVAAREVAAAISFARDETVRTGKPYGVNISASSQRLRVYRLVTSPSPTPAYDVYNPLDKKLYDLQFTADPALSGVQVSAVSLYYRGLAGPVDFVNFDAWGTPKYNDSGTIRLLNNGEIKLASGDAERIIKVDPMTGRVTVL